jgi:hypothetical protein
MRTRTRSVAAVSAAVGSLTFGLSGATGASAGSAGALAPLGAVSNVVVGGVLSNGAPIAGATVLAFVWPNDKTAEASTAKILQTKALTPVRTDVSGKFAISLNLSSLSASYLDAKGRPNIELQVVGGSRMADWSFTVQPAAGGRFTAHAADGETSAGPETVLFDLGKSTATELVGATATTFRSADSAVKATSGVTNHVATRAVPTALRSQVGALSANGTASSPSVPAPACYYASPHRSETNRAEPFSHVYPGRTAPATIHQVYGVDHSIGIAYADGNSWTGGADGGTKTISLEAYGTKTLTGNSTAFNSLNFDDYVNICGWTLREASSVYAILSRIDAAAEPNFTYCTTYTSGTYGKIKGVNITYTNDTNVGPVSVNSQSGYNSSTELSWQINGKSQICGSNDGWANSREAEANSY